MAAYEGLVPRQYRSGSSVKKRSCLTKTGNPTLRAKLYWAAMAAAEHSPELKRFYERLRKAGKSKMCALGALMRKLLHIAFGILKHQTPYNPAMVR